MPKPDIAVSIWVARSPGDIWNYICDVSNETLWRYGVHLAQWISEPPHGIGSSGFHIVEGAGDYPWKVAEWEEQRAVSWDVIGGRFEGVRAGYHISPENAGSHVMIHMTVKSNVLMKIVVRVMKRFIGRQLTGDLERLKAVMETQTPGMPTS